MQVFRLPLAVLEVYDKTVVFVRVRIRLFNATFNNISATSWRPVLLVEEIGVPGENVLSVLQYTDSDCPFGIFKLFLQLPLQSVHITTNVVNSNPTQTRCSRYNNLSYSLSVTLDRTYKTKD
jgi:hypothetical protein